MKSCWLPAGVSVQWPKMNSTRNILSNLIFGSSNYLLYLCFWSIHSCDSNIVVEFWAQLLGRTKHCWNWIDVWSDGLRTIIFWQGWFIPHALRKCPQIVHVKTSECNRWLSIWMHCDARYFFFLSLGEEKNPHNKWAGGLCTVDMLSFMLDGLAEYKYSKKSEWQHVAIAKFIFTLRMWNAACSRLVQLWHVRCILTKKHSSIFC